MLEFKMWHTLIINCSYINKKSLNQIIQAYWFLTNHLFPVPHPVLGVIHFHLYLFYYKTLGNFMLQKIFVFILNYSSEGALCFPEWEIGYAVLSQSNDMYEYSYMMVAVPNTELALLKWASCFKREYDTVFIPEVAVGWLSVGLQWRIRGRKSWGTRRELSWPFLKAFSKFVCNNKSNQMTPVKGRKGQNTLHKEMLVCCMRQKCVFSVVKIITYFFV